ncbi:MAG: SsrA-binding protein [Patescibacteria group bacterium]|nr:SsrA-binding protein [Patescibacteria group bacterium]
MLKYLVENREIGAMAPRYKVEAGLVLTGAEAKSLKAGNGRLNGAYLKVFSDGAYLVGFRIGRYRYDARAAQNPTRLRKVLLNKRELLKIAGLISQRGFVCVPSRVYLKDRFIKVELVVGQVLRKWEKREKEKEKEQAREVERSLSEY